MRRRSRFLIQERLYYESIDIERCDAGAQPLAQAEAKPFIDLAEQL